MDLRELAQSHAGALLHGATLRINRAETDLVAARPDLAAEPDAVGALLARDGLAADALAAAGDEHGHARGRAEAERHRAAAGELGRAELERGGPGAGVRGAGRPGRGARRRGRRGRAAGDVERGAARGRLAGLADEGRVDRLAAALGRGLDQRLVAAVEDERERGGEDRRQVVEDGGDRAVGPQLGETDELLLQAGRV